MACTMLFGIVALTRIGISQYPDVDYPNITVSLSWPGASPPAVEREIARADRAGDLAGRGRAVDRRRRRAPGCARITATFDMSRNVDLALQDVQAKVAQAQRSLPDRRPAATVSKSNPDDTPILTVGVSGPFSRQMLSDVARYQVQERLQTVPGVGQITLNGVPRPQRPHLARREPARREGRRRDRHHRAPSSSEHVEVPGGQLDDRRPPAQRAPARRGARSRRASQARRRRVNERARSTSRTSRSSRTASRTSTSIARLDGVPLQALGVLKQRGTNAVAVATAVRAKVAEIQTSLPEGMKVEVLFDSTIFIEESVHEIELELGLALVLTAFVCWLFLGSLSSTMNVVLAIPMSLLGTVAVIYFLRLHAQHLHAARPVARRRPRRRRRRHGHGEHLPPRGDGEGHARSPRPTARRRSPSPRSPRRSPSSRSSCPSSS